VVKAPSLRAVGGVNISDMLVFATNDPRDEHRALNGASWVVGRNMKHDLQNRPAGQTHPARIEASSVEPTC